MVSLEKLATDIGNKLPRVVGVPLFVVLGLVKCCVFNQTIKRNTNGSMLILVDQQGRWGVHHSATMMCFLDTLGGEIEVDESPRQAVHREATEEGVTQQDGLRQSYQLKPVRVFGFWYDAVHVFFRYDSHADDIRPSNESVRVIWLLPEAILKYRWV